MFSLLGFRLCGFCFGLWLGPSASTLLLVVVLLLLLRLRRRLLTTTIPATTTTTKVQEEKIIISAHMAEKDAFRAKPLRAPGLRELSGLGIAV